MVKFSILGKGEKHHSAKNTENQTIPTSAVQHFAVGQTIWLTSTIDTGKIAAGGLLTIKWYENDNLYATSKRYFQAKDRAVAAALKAIPIRSHQVYTQPGKGKVEVYWNHQLVTTLNFIVQ